MRATKVLQKCLDGALVSMHACRQRVLFMAVEALIAGRRLTLMDVARAWPGAERVRAPLKALDRLLSNGRLHAEREKIYAGMARWLMRTARPIIVVDGSDLKADGSWHLLRAAIPVGGRTLPILDMVFPNGQQSTPAAERLFLQRLTAIVPSGVRPIVITDAGFRAPWFRAVEAMGWYWVGRLRHRTLVKPADTTDPWVACKTLYKRASATPRDLGLMDTVRNRALTCRVALVRNPPKGRKALNRQGRPRRSKHNRQNAAREREPWIILASPALADLSAAQLIKLYARRMQIELSFRDLKSHRYGQCFEYSLTRKGKRIEILLLLQALAAFACWLFGMACESAGIDRWLAPFRSARKLYSTQRVGQEALRRRWPSSTAHAIIMQLRNPAAALLEQLAVPT
ncbi:MAG: IS4 family transposase [Rudaea sp.]